MPPTTYIDIARIEAADSCVLPRGARRRYKHCGAGGQYSNSGAKSGVRGKRSEAVLEIDSAAASGLIRRAKKPVSDPGDLAASDLGKFVVSKSGTSI